MEPASIIGLLNEIHRTQQLLLEKTSHFERRLDAIEENVHSIKIKTNQPAQRSKKLRIMEPPRESHKIKLCDIINIRQCQPVMKHVEVVFFSSLEFAFCIVLIETLCDGLHIGHDCTRFVYEESDCCDNHYHIDVKTQLRRIREWFNAHENYKNAMPFKKQHTIDFDVKKKKDISIPLLGYYNEQWCSSSYKSKIMTLYDMFSIKVIQQFGEWQDEHADAIERNSLPRNLDYTECVLKIMGHPDDMNTMSKSVDIICDYLGQIC